MGTQQSANRLPVCSQNSSKARLRSLESLHGFVAAATKELMWLNEKEEEEVGFDWSDRNANMAAKKESYSVSHSEFQERSHICPHPVPLLGTLWVASQF